MFVRPKRQDAYAGKLLQDQLRLAALDACQTGKFVDRDGDRALLLLHLLGEEADQAAGVVPDHQGLHLVVRFAEPVRETFDEPDGDLHVAPQQGLECLAVNDEHVAILNRLGRGGARLVVQDRHLPEEFSLLEGGEGLLDAPDLLADLYFPRLQDEHFLTAVALTEKDRTRGKVFPELCEHW